MKTLKIQQFPVPETVSEELKPIVSGPPSPFWNDHPQSIEQWHEWVKGIELETLKAIPALKALMKVKVEKSQLGGVDIFTIHPKQVAPENKHRILLHFHGGGYVIHPGESGLEEAIMMAGYGQISVISVDYRMAPDFPYPAATDDALSVYQALLKQYNPKHIGVFGTSTGGGMTLALMLNAKKNNLPLPAAIFVGTPWTDLSKTGDSYFTHAGIDNVLVSYEGWLSDAVRVYAGNYDLKNPLISPYYGDVSGFPPTLLVTGTRDLFLSITIRMHLKLRDAGVIADLVVLEGLSHAQYLMVPDAPETKRYFHEGSRFFNQYLSQ